MAGSRSVSDRTRGKRSSQPETPSARKRKKNEDDERKEEDEDIVIWESGPGPGPEEENHLEKEKEGEEEDSDDEEIRILFEEKLAYRNVGKGAGRIGSKNEKRGVGSGGGSGKEVEKNKNNGKMKAVLEKEEKRGKKEVKEKEKKEKRGKKDVKEKEEQRGKKDVKEKEEKRGKKVVVVFEEDEIEREEGTECKFPMKRIQKIMKDCDSSVRLSQEAIFLANKASEKFLELYCREAYACAFLDHKKHVSYDHLASVVSKRKRFKFLSDIIPQKVKAEDALAEASISDK